MRQLRVLSVVMISLPTLVSAQTGADGTNELIQKLLARIDKLEARVAQLESGGHATTPAATPDAAQVLPPARPIQHDHDAAPSDAAQTVYPALKISGFSDFDFSSTNLRGPSGGFGAQTLLGAHSGFQEGQFDLHLSSALSSKVNVLSELSLTARSDAGTGTPPATGFNAEVERLIIRYDLDDAFKVSFGRYHTPINYWNTQFHHGQWLQTTISRPEMTQFGGSFIPVHFVGMLVEGTVPASGLNLTYNVGLGNGRGQVISRGGDLGDINNNRAWLVNAYLKPDFAYGLRVGGSVYRDEISPATGLPTREWIQSGHIAWEKEKPEVIAEFANVTHQPIGGTGPSHSQAFYVQTAYRLPWWHQTWKPYYRLESIHVPRSDVLFRAVPSFLGSTFGVRYDITTFAAFKFEYRIYDRRDLLTIHGVFAQTSFTF
ncbi:MAG TPA: hypothetical protein VKU19_17780 [Bryobacteraceae bacterium]|nr:hypothetical protein [Bryobacteraceae bacterium]